MHNYWGNIFNFYGFFLCRWGSYSVTSSVTWSKLTTFSCIYSGKFVESLLCLGTMAGLGLQIFDLQVLGDYWEAGHPGVSTCKGVSALRVEAGSRRTSQGRHPEDQGWPIQVHKHMYHKLCKEKKRWHHLFECAQMRVVIFWMFTLSLILCSALSCEFPACLLHPWFISKATEVQCPCK